MQDPPELKLLLEQHRLLPQPDARLSGAGTVFVHVLLAVGLVLAPPVQRTAARAPQILADLGKATPLVAPPKQLTQTEPAKTGKVSTEVNLEGLLSRPSVAQPPPAESMTRPAAPRTIEAPPVPLPPAPNPMAEPPRIEVARNEMGPDLTRDLPVGLGNPDAPARPRIEPAEKPSIAFEKPGGFRGTSAVSGGGGAVPLPPKPTSIEDAARQMARGGGGGLVVGDLGDGIGGLGAALNNPGAPLRQSSNLELLSDPMGVDFRPYLIRILSTVRRNWLAVIPQSARMGRRGKVQIQFAIDKDGSVPKLVIALPSGTEALDRAAVAGVSASNPFPPLPDEFKGRQVRLQFTFLYNVPSR